jgi:hypothetical protein
MLYTSYRANRQAREESDYCLREGTPKHYEYHEDRVDEQLMLHLNRELHADQLSSRMLKAQGLQVHEMLLVLALALALH